MTVCITVSWEDDIVLGGIKTGVPPNLAFPGALAASPGGRVYPGAWGIMLLHLLLWDARFLCPLGVDSISKSTAP